MFRYLWEYEIVTLGITLAFVLFYEEEISILVERKKKMTFFATITTKLAINFTPIKRQSKRLFF